MATGISNYAVADFETLTQQPTRVWLWGYTSGVSDNDFRWGVSIDSFIDFVFSKECATNLIYFHNLKFDGYFIMYYILQSLKLPRDDNLKLHSCYTTLIGRMGQWYQITLKINGRKVHFRDSLKKLLVSVSALSKSYNIPQLKGEIDYGKPRQPYDAPTENEISYVKNDVEIVYKSLYIQITNGLIRMTAGSDAFNKYKQTLKSFTKWFPVLEDAADDYFRMSYKGGLVYVNPLHKNTVVGGGIVLDVNSMYPWALKNMPMPYGIPKPLDKLDFTKTFICRVIIDFDIKDGRIPMIQNKHGLFNNRDYILRSGEPMQITITSEDLKLAMDTYDFYTLDFIDGHYFNTSTELFAEYIDYWTKIKEESTGGVRTSAKLMLNSLYGKFGKNPNVTQKVPVIEDDIIRLKVMEETFSNSVYVPVSSFVTAYSRRKLIDGATLFGDNFCYCDTDSLHILGNKTMNLELHDTKLGAWKIESRFDRAKFIQAKTYVEEYQGELTVTAAGLPRTCYKHVTFDNFNLGQRYPDKLVQKSVPGGAILSPTMHTLGGAITHV